MGEKANTATKRAAMSPRSIKDKSLKKTKIVRSPQEAPKFAKTIGSTRNDGESDISEGEDEPGFSRMHTSAAGNDKEYQVPDSFTTILRDEFPDENPFSAKNLQRKEIWLVTAPVDMPVHRLPLVKPVDLIEGNPVLQTKAGRRYCLKLEEDQEVAVMGVELLVPDSDGQYRIATNRISKTFRATESLPVPEGLLNNYAPQMEPVRLQPEGLRQRFQPFGSIDICGQGRTTEDFMDIDEEVQEKSLSDSRRKKQKICLDAGEGEHSKGDRKKKKHKRKDKEKRSE